MHEATFVPLTDDERANCLDIVGTGGDGTHSINVSMMAALVVAGAGAPVCKHGNRSASSKCGAADVLEMLGVAIELHADGVAACVREVGIGFCFAPMFHPAFRFTGPPRRELGIPTTFNLLGPMANPGRVKRQLIGVADPQFAQPMIETLERQGLTDAWVVHGDGMDELTTTGPSRVLALSEGTITEFSIDPADYGLAPATADDLRGGAPRGERPGRQAGVGGREGAAPRHRAAQRRRRPGRGRTRRRCRRRDRDGGGGDRRGARTGEPRRLDQGVANPGSCGSRSLIGNRPFAAAAHRELRGSLVAEPGETQCLVDLVA